jgi:hypothetical protein
MIEQSYYIIQHNYESKPEIVTSNDITIYNMPSIIQGPYSIEKAKQVLQTIQTLQSLLWSL